MKVTVIIPVYNQENLVLKAINSIPKRDDIEIIVIDDMSTDNTWENLMKYRNNHPEMLNLILLYNTENKGVGYTVNKGYDYARGEYVVLLGSDDYFYKKGFEECLTKLDGTDLIYFNLKDNEGNIWEVNEESKNIYVGSVKFMRKDFIGDIRCPEIRAEEDLYFYKKLMEKKPTEKFTNIVVKHYNYPRENSLTDLKRKGVI